MQLCSKAAHVMEDESIFLNIIKCTLSSWAIKKSNWQIHLEISIFSHILAALVCRMFPSLIYLSLILRVTLSLSYFPLFSSKHCLILKQKTLWLNAAGLEHSVPWQNPLTALYFQVIVHLKAEQRHIVLQMLLLCISRCACREQQIIVYIAKKITVHNH